MKAEAFASAHCGAGCRVTQRPVFRRRNEGGGFRLRAPNSSLRCSNPKSCRNEGGGFRLRAPVRWGLALCRSPRSRNEGGGFRLRALEFGDRGKEAHPYLAAMKAEAFASAHFRTNNPSAVAVSAAMKAEAFASAHLALRLVLRGVAELAAMKAEAFASAHCVVGAIRWPWLVGRNEGGGFRLRAPALVA